MSADRIKLLQQYLTDDPHDAFTLYALALEYINLQDYSLAKKFFSTLVEKHPDYLPVYYHFGKLNELISQNQDANSFYLKGIELAKKQNQLHALRELKQAYNLLNNLEDEI